MRTLMAVALVSLVGTLAPGLARDARADCGGLAETVGVRLKLRGGRLLRGYVVWRQNQIWSGQWVCSESPEAWLASLNRVVGADAVQTGPDNALVLYGELHRIRYPREDYVTLRGSVRRVPLSSIREVSRDPRRKLRVRWDCRFDLPRLTRAEIKRLQTKKPRHVVSQYTGSSEEEYVLYGNRISLAQLLRHVFCGKDLVTWRAISVDGHRVCALQESRIPEPRELPRDLPEDIRSAALDFHEDVDQTVSGVIDVWDRHFDELDRLETELNTLGGTTDELRRRSEIKTEMTRLGSVAWRSERRLVRSYCRSYGNRQRMRRQGLIYLRWEGD